MESVKKFITKKNIALLGICVSAYVIILLGLLFLATTLLLSVVSIFSLLMWLGILADIAVIAGLIILVVDKKTLTKPVIALGVLHGVNLILLLGKGRGLMAALGIAGSAYNMFGGYGGLGSSLTGLSSIGSYLFRSSDFIVMLVLILGVNIAILALSIGLLGKGKELTTGKVAQSSKDSPELQTPVYGEQPNQVDNNQSKASEEAPKEETKAEPEVATEKEVVEETAKVEDEAQK